MLQKTALGWYHQETKSIWTFEELEWYLKDHEGPSTSFKQLETFLENFNWDIDDPELKFFFYKTMVVKDMTRKTFRFASFRKRDVGDGVHLLLLNSPTFSTYLIPRMRPSTRKERKVLPFIQVL